MTSQQISSLIASLTSTVSGTTKYVWGIEITQAWVYAYTLLSSSIILVLLGFTSLFFAKMLYKNANSKSTNRVYEEWTESGYGIMSIIVLIIGILLFIASLIILVMSVSTFFNIQGTALTFLLSA